MYPSRRVDRLPQPILNDKARDNRSLANRELNNVLGLVPLDRLDVTSGAVDDIVSFQLPLEDHEYHNPPLPYISSASRVSPKLYSQLRKLPPRAQQKLKSVKTPYNKTPHQAIQSTISSIPLGLAINPNTISVYSSYFLTFLSWWEWKHNTPSSPEQTYTVDAAFNFCTDLIKAEYNDPLVYYNVVLSVLSQARTPKGRRYLEADFLVQLDINNHRQTLQNYKRKYQPHQAALVPATLFTHYHLSFPHGALLLLWTYIAARISSIEGLDFQFSQTFDNHESAAFFRVTHLKGSLSNTHLASVYCNCLTYAQGDLLCCLHSPRYSMTR